MALAPWLQNMADPGKTDPVTYQNFQTYAPTINSVAKSTGVPVDILGSLISSESNFNPAAYNQSGATGIAQILPSTAQNPGYGLSPVDPNNPYQSIDFAGKYLAALYPQYGNWQDTLAAYKGGVNSPLAQQQASSVLSNAGAGDVALAANTGATANPDGSLNIDISPVIPKKNSTDGSASDQQKQVNGLLDAFLAWLTKYAVPALLLLVGVYIILVSSRSVFGQKIDINSFKGA